MRKINIAIADDHDLVRKGFIKMLADFKQINIIVEAKDGRELLDKLMIHNADVILLDLDMPVLSGSKVLEKLREIKSTAKVIIISALTTHLDVLENVRLGAVSFLTKHTDIETLVCAIHDVLEQGFYFDVRTLELLDKNGLSPLGAFKKLNQKELRILKLLCDNKSQDEIAQFIGISLNTVRWYKHQILQKTNTETMIELREYSVKHKYITQ